MFWRQRRDDALVEALRDEVRFLRGLLEDAHARLAGLAADRPGEPSAMHTWPTNRAAALASFETDLQETPAPLPGVPAGLHERLEQVWGGANEPPSTTVWVNKNSEE